MAPKKKEIFICISQSLNSSQSIKVGARKDDGLERSMLTTKEEEGEGVKGREGKVGWEGGRKRRRDRGMGSGE